MARSWPQAGRPTSSASPVSARPVRSDAQWQAPELALADAPPLEETDDTQRAADKRERALRRGMTAEELQARYRVRWIPE
ncbi:hypothetical protein [Streptomyces tailanensis]|uniref:hypothetical protein n=1 Tax=Streptomyces tailanensis TaxID=2569858 RepID=UPI00155A4ADC|nr:hypothetical protein [Streptomyces tailanensis]